MNELGKRIAARRRELKMSQPALAKAAGLSVSYIGMVETGRRTPYTTTLCDLATALQTTTSNLLARDEVVSPGGAIGSLVVYLQARRCTEEDVRRLEAVARAMFQVMR